MMKQKKKWAASHEEKKLHLHMIVVKNGQTASKNKTESNFSVLVYCQALLAFKKLWLAFNQFRN